MIISKVISSGTILDCPRETHLCRLDSRQRYNITRIYFYSLSRNLASIRQASVNREIVIHGLCKDYSKLPFLRLWIMKHKNLKIVILFLIRPRYPAVRWRYVLISEYAYHCCDDLFLLRVYVHLSCIPSDLIAPIKLCNRH